jgi:hypothetical protein
MSKRAYCTISSQGHSAYGEWVLAQLKQWDPEALYFHLVVDGNREEHQLSCEAISKMPHAAVIIEKYAANTDKLRWSLKPILLQYILQEKEIAEVMYLDNDLCFYQSPQAIWDALAGSAMLITPHRYPANPLKEQNWLEANFRVGLYNAGFIATNQKAAQALDWWAAACRYRCEKNYYRGLFDDQKYLDLIPVMFDEIKVFKHPGCNLAGWNLHACQLSFVGNKFLVNEQDLIFVHFNPFTIAGFENSTDMVVKDILQAYSTQLHKSGLNLRRNTQSALSRNIEAFKLYLWQLLNRWNKS